jgi:hypothetical protein
LTVAIAAKSGGSGQWIYGAGDSNFSGGGNDLYQAPFSAPGVYTADFTAHFGANESIEIGATNGVTLDIDYVMLQEITGTTTGWGANPAADATAISSMDVFVLEQKTGMNKIFAQWELRALADTGDRMVPGRQAMKELCPYTYRTWNGTAFVAAAYKPCPYVGSVYLDINNNPTTQANDACDHKVDGGCVGRRAGWPNGILGFGGFPGMSRYRMS